MGKESQGLYLAKLILVVSLIVFSGALAGSVTWLAKNYRPAIIAPQEIVVEPYPITINGGKLTLESIKNAEYKHEWFDYTANDSSQKILKFKDGSYSEANPLSASGSGQYIGVYEDKVAFGDLNKDSIIDAAVILDSFGGGTGHFYELAVVMNKNGKPAHIALEYLGDRVVITSIEIKEGKIEINMVIQGPDDGMCCPTLRKIFEYGLSGDKLMKIRDYKYDEIVSSDIPGWERYQNNNYKFSIDYPMQWRAHINSFAGEPNMIFCSPDFFEEKNIGWLSFNDDPETKGCASKRRVWSEDGQNLIMVEGVGEVVVDEYYRKWKEKITVPISSVSLFVKAEKMDYADKSSHVYLGNNSFGHWYLIKDGDDVNNDNVFNKIRSTFKFINNTELEDVALNYCLEKGPSKIRLTYTENMKQLSLNFDRDKDKEIAGVCSTGGDYDKEGLLFVLDSENGEYKPILEEEGQIQHQRFYDFQNLQIVDADKDGINEIMYEGMGWYMAGGDFWIKLYSPKYKEWFSKTKSWSLDESDPTEEKRIEKTEVSKNLENKKYQVFKNFLLKQNFSL